MIDLEELNLERSKVADKIIHLENTKKLRVLYIGIENGSVPCQYPGNIGRKSERCCI